MEHEDIGAGCPVDHSPPLGVEAGLGGDGAGLMAAEGGGLWDEAVAGGEALEGVGDLRALMKALAKPSTPACPYVLQVDDAHPGAQSTSRSNDQ